MTPSTHRPRRSEAGLSIVSVLVAIAFMGLLAAGMSTIMGRGFNAQAKLTAGSELEAIKFSLLRTLDCNNTLNTTPSGPTLSCGSYPLVPLRRRGSPNSAVLDINPSDKVGRWTVRAGCSGNEIIVKATRPGNDPLSGRPWSNIPEASDLFRGTSDLCREYFDPSYRRNKSYPLRDLASAVAGNCAANVCFLQGCAGIMATRPGHYFMANSACKRLCTGSGWSGGAITECNGTNPAWFNQVAECSCIP